jgi:NO-binding membrane sensor protein with MHYT domain
MNAAAFVGNYDHRLVAASVLIAILTSYVVLDLSGRVMAALGRRRTLWLAAGATGMGIGIWSMHYIGMLAYVLPIEVQYDWPTVLASLAAAILASAFALSITTRADLSPIRTCIGGTVMGLGIASMHYIGMEAMRLPAMCHYSPALVTLSVIIAVVVSIVAIRLIRYFREGTIIRGWKKCVSAIVMGGAIPTMHYTGMAAVAFARTDAAPATLSLFPVLPSRL